MGGIFSFVSCLRSGISEVYELNIGILVGLGVGFQVRETMIIVISLLSPYFYVFIYSISICVLDIFQSNQPNQVKFAFVKDFFVSI